MIVLLLGCVDLLEDQSPYLTGPRLLALRAEPPEVAAGASQQLYALAADAEGPLSSLDVRWSLCRAPRPPAELGPVAQDCLEGAPGAELGAGLELEVTLPEDGCSLFGPNPPPPQEGESAGRPVDPDVTGGYYQPILGFSDQGPLLLHSSRLRCGLANVSQELYVAWNRLYHNNQNPEIAALELNGAALTPDDLSAAPVVSAGAELPLRLSWPACPVEDTCGDAVCGASEDRELCPQDCTEALGCAGAEHYVVYDTEMEALLPQRESLSVAWYATGGEFLDARSGRASEDTETMVENNWTAPEQPGPVWVAAVLRDARGGLSYRGYWIQVGP